MSNARRSFRVTVACCLCAGAAWLGLGSTGGSPSVSLDGASVSQLSLGHGLLRVPGAEWLDGGLQARYQALAERADPQAAFARERSRTAYARLDAEGVRRLIESRLPGVVARPGAGGLRLPSGAHVLGYAGSHAVMVSLPGHLHGVVESSLPVARKASHGRYTPISLAVASSGAGFAPVSSDVAVAIPRQISAGVSIPGDGVTVTPLDLSGRTASGSVVGGSVVYPNTQAATDAVVKPTAIGFQLDAVLRSASSPQRLVYKVGMPAGARLVLDSRAGLARVVTGSVTLATISAANASDAAGAGVPAAMAVSGKTLTIDVPHRAGSYLYPVYVDPEVNDSQLAETTGKKRSNWEFKTTSEAKFGHKEVYEGVGKERLETTGTAEYLASESAYWGYETKGNSKIYELKAKTSAKNKGAKIESFLQFSYPEPGKPENALPESKKMLSNEFEEPEYAEKTTTICAWNASKVEECLGGAGKEKNGVRFQQSATASPGAGFKFSDTMSEGVVSISEPSGDHSTTSFNTNSPEVEGEVEIEGKKIVQKRVNALYGSGIWLTNTKGALQMIAKDPGIGVSATHLEYEKSAGVWERLSEHHYLEVENACKGVQCYAEHAEYWTLDPKLPDGEDKIRYRAQEAIVGTESLATEAESTKTIKIDTKAPHALYLGGLPFGDELTEKAYRLTSEATDGEGSTVASSGIPGVLLGSKGEVLSKGLALYVDGHEVTEVGKQTGCSVAKGACTAKAEWTINGAELGAGHHAIVLTTIDNAGNEKRAEYTISIRHSTPVALGPGSVDPQSGDFALGGTDVSMGSGLTVGRTYSSRATEAGIEGPLGPQWMLNLGTTDSLAEMVDGSILLSDANGKQTIFAKTETNEFEAPTGDANLKLTLEENKETKVKLAYYLENAAKHTKTKFTLAPGGTTLWVPTKQEGTVATDTLTYTYQTAAGNTEYSLPASSQPEEIVSGPNGALWFNRREGEKGKVGTLNVTGPPITEYSPANGVPRFFAAGPDGNVWFTSSGGWVDKITPGGKITEYPVAEGTPAGIAAGPDGNLWFTEPEVAKIAKITTSGATTQYSLPAGGEPSGITSGPDGNLWFTNWSAGKIGKITTTGGVTEYPLSSGSHPEGIVVGADKNLWFANYGKIGKITTSGTITEYTLAAGSGVERLTVGPDGNVWFTNETKNKVGKITTSGAITEYALPEGSEPMGIAAGADGKLWFADRGSSKIGTVPRSGVITEPTEVLAPVPAGVSCAPEMKAGCRALKFAYATGTTATGESQSEWGEYKGRLAKVLLYAYDPVGKKMLETAVSQYAYDSLGRLRAEWDPRVSPSLKTAYGYDAEGHVTALTAPGQESWAFTYGAIAGDAGTGRLLKATRAPASTELWKGEAASAIEAPQVTGAVTEGSALAASKGKWSGGPIAYGYQWQGCDSSGAECSPIAGATNPNYTLAASDVGHTIRVKVTATNGDGSVTATSGATALVQTEASRFTEYSVASTSSPTQIAEGPDGKLWFTTGSKNVIGKITTLGIVTEYTLPAGYADGIVAGPDGNLWYTNNGTGKIGKMTVTGVVTEYAVPAGAPVAITAGPDGNLWYTNRSDGKIGKITTSGAVTEYGSGIAAEGIASGPDGNLWFADTGKGKVGKITTAGVVTEYSLPGSLHDPTDIVAGPDGNLWFPDYLKGQIDKITTAGVVTAYSANGSTGVHIAAGPDGKLWFTTGSSLGSITTTGTVSYFAVPANNTEDVVKGPDGKVWYTTTGQHKIGKVSPTLLASGEARAPEPGITMGYNTPLGSGSGRPNMAATQVEKWGQTDVPVEATAIFPPDSPQGWPASSYARATIHYLDEQGREVNVSSPSTASYGSVSTTEYNEENGVTRTLSPDNRQAALEAGSKSVEVAKSLAAYYSYREECSKESENKHEVESFFSARLCDVEGPQHTIKYMTGKEQKEMLGRLHTKYFYDEEAPLGETYNLQTKTSTIAELANEEEVEVRKTVTSYSGQSNLGWKLRAPTSVTVDPEGKKLTSTTFYNGSTGQITETRSPAGGAGGSPHDMKYVYYSAEANSEGYPACGEHPEWSGLLCETLPAKQPETSGVPNLPVVVYASYSMYDEPLVITEAFGSTVRTRTKAYDGAGRLTSSETTSTANTALPKLTDEYNTTTGVLEKLSTTVGEKTQVLTSKYNTLGQLTEYVDADGNIVKYRYGGPENDYALEEVSDGSNGGTGKQTYSYNATTKQLEELTDSAAGVFKASYDAEGNMVSETYPNAMCADSTYNSVGEATKLEYIKTSNCAEHSAPVWFSETRAPAVRGETFNRSSTLAGETYAYDTLGRLTETQETPAGEGCSVRLYAYDEEGNRLSQTTRTPGNEGKCASEGGTTLEHTYDAGNRLTDAGVAYDSFGDIAKVPAADAEGHELSSTFYVDGAVASQAQNGVTNTYNLDPEGRIRETVSGETSTISHYDGAGDAVAWISEGPEKTSRNIPGIDGSLAAVQTNGATPVLQLHDLQGNITATAALSPSETKLLSTYNNTEFGVPNKEKAPPKYSWLGAGGIASTFSTGVITYGATSYVPQIGRALQSQIVEAPGIAPGGSGAGAAYVSQEEPWMMQGAAAEAAEAPGLEAARESEAMEQSAGTGQSLAISSSGEAGSGQEEDWSGGGASISSAPNCKASWKIGSPGDENIYLTGEFKCAHHVANIKMQLCLFWSEGGTIDGHLCTSQGGTQFGNIKEHEQAVYGKCDTKRMYTGFMWVHEWADPRHKAKGLWLKDQYGLTSSQHKWIKCEGGEGESAVPDIIEQLVETFLG